jgi:YfiR/HmsC-like
MLALGCLLASEVYAQATPEYRAKAGFLYNFIAFTDWPPRVGSPLPLCVYGGNPFGDELTALEGKTVNGRTLTIRYPGSLDQLKGCRVVFVADSAIANLSGILDTLRGEPVLTVTDSKGALDAGVGINMLVRQNKIAFEVNLAATRRADLALSSKLLRLASEVRQ